MTKKSDMPTDKPYIWRQKSLTLAGETRNFFKYEYANGFMLYVPRDAFPRTVGVPAPLVLYMDLME